MTELGKKGPRDQLVHILSEAEVASDQVRRKAQSLVETTTLSGTMAGALRVIIAAAPDDSALPQQTWARLIESWSTQVDQLQQADATLGAAQAVATATGSTGLTTTVASPIYSSWIGPKEKAAVVTIQSILHRPSLFSDVAALLQSFSLDTTYPGMRSALQHLEEGRAALERPPAEGPQAAAVLIPARESIQRVLADLARRIPQPKKSKGIAGRVDVIAGQCARQGLPPGYFQRLGQDGTDLIEQLSDTGKFRSVETARVTSLFDATLQFQQSLLKGLDPSVFGPA